MPKYRKKPIVIDAELYRKGLEDAIELYTLPLGATNNPPIVDEWIKANGKIRQLQGRGMAVEVPVIYTLAGKHYISPGDYIITGVKGERYPCKPDIFEATYDLAE